MDADFIAGIDIENNLDITVLERNVYTILDVLSQVGGLASALVSLVVGIIGLMNYNHLESYMASKVFKIYEDNSDKHSSSNSQAITFSTWGNITECLTDALPSRLVCCKKTKRQRVIKKARVALSEEMDILELVKSMRFLKLAFKRLLPDEEINKL